LLGSGVAGWPLAAGAQQPAMPVIGFLEIRSPETIIERLRAFRQGLKETGYVEGENIAMDYRWAEQTERLPDLTAQLVRRQVAVIVTAGGFATALAAKDAPTTIPIVFAVSEDPVRLGLVASLARPGGNLTGVNLLSTELTAKRLELLREMLPRASRIAVLVNPANTVNTQTTLREVEAAGNAIGLQTQIVNAGTNREIDTAFAAFARERPDAVFLGQDAFFNGRRLQLANWAARHALPMTSGSRDICEVGGLMSYGSNIVDTYRQEGVYVGRILKGAKPADLPVEQSAKFELVINAQTARILGIEIPSTLIARADSNRMKRRAFITLLGGAAAAWPLAARAQQPAMPVVAFVHGGSSDASARNALPFRKGLGEIGYVEGQDVTVEYHWLDGQYDRLPALMADLVRRRVAVIATPGGNLAAQMAKTATATIPIVFSVGEDPVKLGLVASLARPGGNATGINFFAQEVTAKRLGLLHELVPKAVRIAVLGNP